MASRALPALDDEWCLATSASQTHDDKNWKSSMWPVLTLACVISQASAKHSANKLLSSMELSPP